jgi:hypothetical protein
MTAISEPPTSMWTVPELSSSMDPRDWGRAAARALDSLARLVSGSSGRPDPASIMDQDLILRVSRCAGGVKIVLGIPRTRAAPTAISAGTDAGPSLVKSNPGFARRMRPASFR